MKSKLTNTDVREFLKDYKDRCEIEFLEEGGREKSDLIKSAKKRGILLEGSRDLGALKTIYLFTEKYNSNGALVPANEFQKVLPQLIGKPMNISHNRKVIVGFYIDYKYIVKENKAIAYAVFFKSNYPDLWKKAKKFQKAKKLSSSFEIWTNKNKYSDDSHYTLKNIELAGGALIFEENGELPAFKDAKVLAIAKKELKQIVDEKCLVCASKYDNEELMTAEETIKTEEIKKEITSSKIKCSNCANEFERGIEQINIKCPQCFAILNKEGVMIYPPQIKDFKMLCPSCNVSNWLIVFKGEKNTKLKCLSCSKEYIATFAEKAEGSLLGKTRFIYTGSVSCHQCNTRIPIESISDINIRKIKCPKCGLQFSVDTYEETYKKIARIEAIKVIASEPIKSSKEGGQKMDKKGKVEEKTKVQEPVKIAKEPKKEVKPKVKEPKKEVKPKVLEQLQKQEVKVEDKKEAIKPEPPKEEKPKVVDVKVIKKGETPKIDVVDAEKTIVKLEDEVEKAKQLKVVSFLKRYPKVVKKAIDKIRKLRKELVEAKKKLNTEMEKSIKKLEKKVDFYKENAKTIFERQSIIGTDNLTDEEILNDDKFERAKLEIETAKLRVKNDTASEIVGSKTHDKGYYNKVQKEIDDVAFGRNKED